MAWCIGSSLAQAHHAFKPFYHLCKEIRFFIYLFEFFTMQPSFLHFACLVWQYTALHVSPLFRDVGLKSDFVDDCSLQASRHIQMM
jgi:hypothetical protein